MIKYPFRKGFLGLKAQILQGTAALLHISAKMIRVAISIRRGKVIE